VEGTSKALSRELELEHQRIAGQLEGLKDTARRTPGDRTHDVVRDTEYHKVITIACFVDDMRKRE